MGLNRNQSPKLETNVRTKTVLKREAEIINRRTGNVFYQTENFSPPARSAKSRDFDKK